MSRAARIAIAKTAAALALLLAGCADKPATPEWQMNAKSGIDRSVAAYLEGDSRVEAQEFEGVRNAIARTGRPALLARAELVRCATRVASLVLDDCAAYRPLEADAEPAERAYAAYLFGRASPADVALLPEQHRAIAAAPAGPASALAALERMNDPLARLVGAAVLLQTGRADRDVVARAVDTASAQGWRRPLLAWLQVQARQAEAAGDTVEAARIRRRIGVVERVASAASSP